MARTILGLMALALLLWVQQGPLWNWVVEDAAISFAYARNASEGLGLVPFAGAERVEGYSNPTWVALLALAHRLGLDLFTAARGAGAVLSAATVVAVYAAGRQLTPARPVVAWVAATAVALDPQHVIWGASGLENPLFSTLLAVGVWRLLADAPGRPWAVLAFAALALTRPEGPAYCGVACAAAVFGAPSGHRVALVGAWLRWAALPVAGAHGLRFAYFAMELPATYYAKLGDFSFDPYAWDARSWTYLRGWASTTGAGYWIGVFAVGMVGTRGWRLRLVAALVVVFAAVFLLGHGWVPPWMNVWLLWLTLVGLPLCVPAPHRAHRWLVWGLGAVALVFCVRSGGDWMRGFRWLSLLSVPLALLTGLGVDQLLRRATSMRAWWVAPVMLGLALPAYVAPRWVHLADLVRKPVASPAAIHRRLRHDKNVLRRTVWLDRRVRVLDHDMGAMLWWGGDGVHLNDSRGLVDLPYALHHSQRAFVSDYQFGSRPPDMAHAHASTFRALRWLPQFRTGFVEIPGYGTGPEPHGGQVIRTGLFLAAAEPMGEPLARWGDIELVEVRAPSPEVAPGAGLFIELSMGREAKLGFRPVLILTDGVEIAAAWDLPPAYDWVPVSRWDGRVWTGRHAVVVPETVPEGQYGLRLAVLNGDGTVAQIARPASLSVPPEPVWCAGEVDLGVEVHVVSWDAMVAAAAADRQSALAHAEARRCVAAEEAWDQALRHRARSGEWRDANRPEVAAALARCWSLRGGRGARTGDALLERVEELQRARDWDPRSEVLYEEVQAVSADAWSRGMSARAAGDADQSFLWFDAAVRAEPSMAWARRYAEQARVQRLGLEAIPGPRWPLDPPAPAR